MNRRELLKLLSALAVLGPKGAAKALENPSSLYDLPPFGNATLLYFSDLHGQAFPHYFMEPPNLIAPKPLMGRPGYLTGEAILRAYGVARGTPLAYLLSHLDFVELARALGPIGEGSPGRRFGSIRSLEARFNRAGASSRAARRRARGAMPMS
jgi:sulfur-oxidizing protein SoxB